MLMPPAGVYVAPKRVAAAMPDDPDATDGAGARERRKAEHQARKAKRSEFLQELARDIEGAPEEVLNVPQCLAYMHLTHTFPHLYI